MKILVSSIDANPHRDLVRNPVSDEQIAKLVESINRTGFWDNLVVRVNPEAEGRYQLAYGHNRLAACVKAGITEVNLPCRSLSEYDMYCCMVDENNTQQSITAKIVFENVTAALALAERLLLSTENVNDFNSLLKTSNRPDVDASDFWNAQKYSQAKSAISESGDGLGRDFVAHFMPSPPHNDTLQSVIDSYYADRRKAAAEKRKAAELEAARIADEERQRLEAEAQEKHEAELQAQREANEAARLQREAKAAADKAVREQNESARLKALEDERIQREAKAAADKAVKKAKEEKDKATKDAVKQAKQSSDHTANANRESAKSERMDYAGVDRDLLESLVSTSKMNDVVKLIKQNKIPKGFHAELIEAAQGWSPDGTSSEKAGTAISIKGASWWDERSGARAKRMADAAKQSRHEKLTQKYGSAPFVNTVFSFAEKLNTANKAAKQDLTACAEYFDTLSPQEVEKLEKLLTAIQADMGTWMNDVLAKIRQSKSPVEIDITPVIPSLVLLSE